MKIMRKLAAALLAAALAAALAVPSLAAFDQDTLNGIVLIRTGAPALSSISALHISKTMEVFILKAFPLFPFFPYKNRTIF